jgi:hypothetical protein
MSDGWKYPPFELTVDPEGSGKLFGRGSSDDKGPILGWVNVIEAHVKLGLEMPVSFRFYGCDMADLILGDLGELEDVLRGHGGVWIGGSR